MGITIDNYPLFNGAVDVSGVYVYVRDIRTTKRDVSNHELNFIAYYTKDASGVPQNIKASGFSDTSTNVISDSWACAYNCVKKNLTDLSFSFVDS